MRPPPRDAAYNRLLQGAGPRRALVYALAAVLVTVAGVMAVRMAMPEDPHATVRVERLPGLGLDDAMETTGVRWDPDTGRTSIDVRERDGAVRRYFLQEEGGELRIWGGDVAPPD